MSGWLIGIEAEFALFYSPPRTHPVRYLFFDPHKTLPQQHSRIPNQNIFSYLFYLPYTIPHKTSKLSLYPSSIRKAFHTTAEAEIESATRTCGKKVIFGTDPDYVYYLLELKTGQPFSTTKKGFKYVETFARNLHLKIRTYLKTVCVYRPLYMRQENKTLGKPTLFPYGMSSRILLRNLDTNTFEKQPVVTNTTGSYHFTFTLPYQETDSCEQMVERHRNFANLVQWIEPLLASAFHSCDDRAVGQGTKYTRGSFRMVYSGWGNFGGSDLRHMRCPNSATLSFQDLSSLGYMEEYIMGRYSLLDPLWRNQIAFQGLPLLAPCRQIQKDTHRSSLGSDFRIRLFVEKEKDSDMYRVFSGVEIRLFDWFHPRHLPVLGQILIMLAEQSRKQGKQSYVYRNIPWNKAVAEVMTQGWKAILPSAYVKKLQSVLGISFSPSHLGAYEVFQALVQALYQETKDGEYTKLMCQLKKVPLLPKINQQSWELAFLTHLLDHPESKKKFRLFFKALRKHLLKQERLSRKKILTLFRQHFSSQWEVNLDDILAFLEDRNVLHVVYGKQGLTEIYGYDRKNGKYVEKELCGKILHAML